MEFLSEFVDVISNNLIHNIMLGKFELPEQDLVPFPKLIVKDSSYKTIPMIMAITSNFDENPVVKLTPIAQ